MMGMDTPAVSLTPIHRTTPVARRGLVFPSRSPAAELIGPRGQRFGQTPEYDAGRLKTAPEEHVMDL